MDPSTINWWAILVAGISAFVLGGVWYSPALFGRVWMRENSLSEDDIKNGNAAKIYGWAFVISLIMSANLGMFLADAPEACLGACAQKTDVAWGSIAGFLAGIWAFAAIAIVALFEQKSARYIFINGCYVLLALVLMGAIIGLWR